MELESAQVASQDEAPPFPPPAPPPPSPPLATVLPSASSCMFQLTHDEMESKERASQVKGKLKRANSDSSLKSSPKMISKSDSAAATSESVSEEKWQWPLFGLLTGTKEKRKEKKEKEKKEKKEKKDMKDSQRGNIAESTERDKVQSNNNITLQGSQGAMEEEAKEGSEGKEKEKEMEEKEKDKKEEKEKDKKEEKEKEKEEKEKGKEKGKEVKIRERDRRLGYSAKGPKSRHELDLLPPPALVLVLKPSDFTGGAVPSASVLQKIKFKAARRKKQFGNLPAAAKLGIGIFTAVAAPVLAAGTVAAVVGGVASSGAAYAIAKDQKSRAASLEKHIEGLVCFPEGHEKLLALKNVSKAHGPEWKINVVYVHHPLRPHEYISLSEFHEHLAADKKRELQDLSKRLGARSITLLDSTDPMITPTIGSKGRHKRQSSLTNSTSVEKAAREMDLSIQFYLAPKEFPNFDESQACWYHLEPSWQTMKAKRMEGVSLELITVQFRLDNDFDVNNELASTFRHLDVDLGGEYTEFQPTDRNYQVHFFNMDDYKELNKVALRQWSNKDICALLTVLNLSKYAEKFKNKDGTDLVLISEKLLKTAYGMKHDASAYTKLLDALDRLLHNTTCTHPVFRKELDPKDEEKLCDFCSKRFALMHEPTLQEGPSKDRKKSIKTRKRSKSEKLDKEKSAEKVPQQDLGYVDSMLEFESEPGQGKNSDLRAESFLSIKLESPRKETEKGSVQQFDENGYFCPYVNLAACDAKEGDEENNKTPRKDKASKTKHKKKNVCV